MAVYRVQRTRDYTVMSNYHLKDKGLTLKSKGLLSMILSLPEEWNYTTRGLASICKEGVDAIGSALKELETAGYIVRRQLRGANGRITDTEYIIYEQPQPPQLENPILENPTTDSPMLENPMTDNPTSENPTQLNKDISRTDLSKKEKSNTDISNTHSIPILSPYPSPFTEDAAEPERKGTERNGSENAERSRDLPGHHQGQYRV